MEHEVGGQPLGIPIGMFDLQNSKPVSRIEDRFHGESVAG